MKKWIVLIAFTFSILAVYAQRIKILTYNIHHGNPPEFPGKINLEEIAQVILQSGADLVGLQEVDVYLSRSNNTDQAKRLAELTGMYYFFSKGIDVEDGEYGTLILSKYEIIKARKYNLPMPIASENRTLALVDVAFPGGQIVTFANTHLDLKEENKIAQADFIAEIGDWYQRPFILVGDFNAEPASKTVAMLEQCFQRNRANNKFTFPNVNPNIEIDYILIGKQTDFKWLDYKVIEAVNASDHLPVFAEVEVVKR
ncbi:endonuclease/exonuclease/phosphatase family protein [Sphingobacterium sp. MYb382]|uniref:endonuclease/exonuclease/phosphatase family protein n=1 Tax=Sphingobacterium sp. MYb382 TaxID=2745278 RepID=UPI0030B1AED3